MTAVSGVKMLMSDPRVAIPSMALPLAVAILIQNVNGMADLLWVSGLGGSAVGGVGLAYPVYGSIVGVGNGLAVGVAAAIARCVGRRDRDGASRSAGQSLFLGVVFSLLVTLVCMLTMDPLISWFDSGEAGTEALAYLIPVFSFCVFITLGSIMSGILRGEGAARASMMIQAAGAMVNIVLDPILIYGLGMGVAGAAWATVIAGAASMMLGLMCYRPRNRMYVSLRARDLIPDARLSRDILVVGLPQAAEYVVMFSINIPMNYIIVGVAGADTVGVYTAGWRVAYLALVPAQAYSGAVVSVCSAEYSARRSGMMSMAYRFAVRRSVLHTVYLSVVLAVLAYPICCVFTAADDLIYLRGSMFLLMMCLAAMLPFMSQVFVCSGFLQALKHSGTALLSSLVRNIVMVSAYAAAAAVFATAASIWISMAAVEIFGGLLMAGLALMYVRRFVRDNPE